MSDNELGIEDLVICKNNGQIHAGGFQINNSLLGEGFAPMQTTNKPMKGGSVSSAFNDLAIPAGLLYLQRSMTAHKYHEKHSEVIDDNLFDKLFNLAQETSSKKFTRKNNNSGTRKTKKNRKK